MRSCGLGSEGGSVFRGGRGVRGRRHVHAMRRFPSRTGGAVRSRPRHYITNKKAARDRPVIDAAEGAGGRRSKRVDGGGPVHRVVRQSPHRVPGAPRAGRRREGVPGRGSTAAAGRLGRARLGLASCFVGIVSRRPPQRQKVKTCEPRLRPADEAPRRTCHSVEAGRVAAGRAHRRQAGAAGAPGLPRGRRRRPGARVHGYVPGRLRGP
mmetsp:Transcript_6770/g.19077  ORF Transcript_6770/g.19077 Transcript_6770/m.19077 type:complete len:209 (-) Transcript_6770:206-832(-)